jgi:hypothetical protein
MKLSVATLGLFELAEDGPNWKVDRLHLPANR